MANDNKLTTLAEVKALIGAGVDPSAGIDPASLYSLDLQYPYIKGFSLTTPTTYSTLRLGTSYIYNGSTGTVNYPSNYIKLIYYGISPVRIFRSVYYEDGYDEYRYDTYMKIYYCLPLSKIGDKVYYKEFSYNGETYSSNSAHLIGYFDVDNYSFDNFSGYIGDFETFLGGTMSDGDYYDPVYINLVKFEDVKQKVIDLILDDPSLFATSIANFPLISNVSSYVEKTQISTMSLRGAQSIDVYTAHWFEPEEQEVLDASGNQVLDPCTGLPLTQIVQVEKTSEYTEPTPTE